MKFLKQSQLNGRNLKDQSVGVVTDDVNVAGAISNARIVLDNTNSLQLPKGVTSERPAGGVVGINGLIRYNDSTNEIEVRSSGVWKRLAYKEPNSIEVQTGPSGGGAIWEGNSIDGGATGEIYYGPLTYSDIDGNPLGLYPAKGSFDITKPQNLIVYVDNVPQLPNVNYILESNPAGTPTALCYAGAPTYPTGVYVKFNGAVPFGKPVTVLHGFDR
jgi:hypothetical protein